MSRGKIANAIRTNVLIFLNLGFFATRICGLLTPPLLYVKDVSPEQIPVVIFLLSNRNYQENLGRLFSFYRNL